MVMFGDLHNQVWSQRQSKLIDLIKMQKPDLILLVGDIFDEKTGHFGSELLLDGLYGLPVFYVTGNHEYLTKGMEKILTTFKDKGVQVLDDTYQTFTSPKGTLIIGGINDTQALSQGYKIKDHQALLKIFQPIRNCDHFSILLAHKPEQYQRYRQYGFDLVVSGHTHGGQIRIPYLLNGLYCADQGFFPLRAGGLYEDPGITQIVNRGMSNPYPLPRFGNPPELCVIDIIKRQS